MFSLSVGLFASVFLFRGTKGGIVLSCPVGDGCTAIQNTPLARSFPVPISLIGTVFFIVLLAGCIWYGPMDRLVRVGLRTGAAISVLLTIYGIQVAQTLCFWCSLILVSLFSASLLTREKAGSEIKVSPLIAGIPLIAIGLAFGFTQPIQSKPIRMSLSEFPRKTSFPEVQFDSSVKRALVVDFSCAHCRKELSDSVKAEQSFVLVPLNNSKKAISEVIACLFVSAQRQEFEKQLLKNLPSGDISDRWVNKMRVELSVTRMDEREARRLLDAGSIFAKKHSIRTVPTLIELTQP